MLACTDPDPEHVHDEGSCCECGSPVHCCGSCPVFVGPPPDKAPCTDCGKLVSIAEVEDLQGERCPKQPPSHNGIRWGHRMLRSDYRRLELNDPNHP